MLRKLNENDYRLTDEEVSSLREKIGVEIKYLRDKN